MQKAEHEFGQAEAEYERGIGAVQPWREDARTSLFESTEPATAGPQAAAGGIGVLGWLKAVVEAIREEIGGESEPSSVSTDQAPVAEKAAWLEQELPRLHALSPAQVEAKLSTMAARPLVEKEGWLGVMVRQSRPGFRVAWLAVGSTAEKAGILLGDRIVAVDGLPTLTESSLGWLFPGNAYIIGGDTRPAARIPVGTSRRYVVLRRGSFVVVDIAVEADPPAGQYSWKKER